MKLKYSKQRKKLKSKLLLQKKLKLLLKQSKMLNLMH